MLTSVGSDGVCDWGGGGVEFGEIGEFMEVAGSPARDSDWEDEVETPPLTPGRL